MAPGDLKSVLKEIKTMREAMDFMNEKFEVYTTILRFLPFKITDNLIRIYLKRTFFKEHSLPLETVSRKII